MPENIRCIQNRADSTHYYQDHSHTVYKCSVNFLFNFFIISFHTTNCCEYCVCLVLWCHKLQPEYRGLENCSHFLKLTQSTKFQRVKYAPHYQV